MEVLQQQRHQQQQAKQLLQEKEVARLIGESPVTAKQQSQAHLFARTTAAEIHTVCAAAARRAAEAGAIITNAKTKQHIFQTPRRRRRVPPIPLCLPRALLPRRLPVSCLQLLHVRLDLLQLLMLQEAAAGCVGSPGLRTPQKWICLILLLFSQRFISLIDGFSLLLCCSACSSRRLVGCLSLLQRSSAFSDCSSSAASAERC